ncbi:MAG: ammonium transporter [Proteobacteria bacterium]|nr:ammonium transporter [Pseudomonadota bacterium]
MNSGDTAFMLVSTMLVMFMTPGLGLFYGGLVRSKNVLSIILQCFISLGIVSIIWVFYGYSLAFGPDIHGFIGNFDWAFLNGVGFSPGPYSDSIPHILFCAFQLMFAIITPALITGAYAERMKFSAFIIFTVLWTTFVYFPVCHWVWGGGWLGKLGALDFAGGTVIHINSGAAALVVAFMIGKRKGWGKDAIMPHNLTMTLLGTGILWFGWFGFNAGSSLSAGGLASMALITTQLSAGAAAVSWIMVEWIYHGKPTTLGAASGALAGLVAITPAAGFVGPVSAISIGLVAGIICCLAMSLKSKFGYDDALDVVAVHGIGGVWGAFATGLFASKAINPAGADGLFYGNPKLVLIQAIGIAAAITYSVIVTIVIVKIINYIVGLRVTEEEEIQGLDVNLHNEVGYTM